MAQWFTSPAGRPAKALTPPRVFALGGGLRSAPLARGGRTAPAPAG